MRVLLLLACLAAAASANANAGGGTAPRPESGLMPPPPQQQTATKRLGFASLGNPFEKITRWFFPSSEGSHSPGRAIGRAPFVHGPTRHHPPSPPSGPQQFSSFGPPRPRFQQPPTPPLKCNPCNKVPWVPIPHAQYKDGGNVLAVVNAPQLHQGLHGNSQQPNVPVYHHSPLPQGFLPTFNNNNNNNHAASEHVSVEHHPSGGGGSAPEIIPSIAIAQYTQSVEYPIDVIQSPIIDVGGSGGDFKSLNTEVQQVPQNHDHIPDNHNEIEVPENHKPVPTEIVNNINTAIGVNSDGGASSYQNINLHAENSVKQETHHTADGIAITPSVQTSIDLSHEFNNNNNNKPHVQDNAQVVFHPNPEGTVLPPIPTQQQPPNEQPAPPFQITTFQQPPSAHAPSVFHVGPPSGFPVSGPPRLVPPSAFGPHQGQFSLPTFQQPPRGGFPSPGQINVLRQIPTAPGLSPPPPPPPVPQNNHPYRFELVPPSGNAINQQIHGTAPPALDYTPWQPTSGFPTDAPPSAADAAVNVATLTQSGNHAGNNNVNLNKRPKKIQIIVPYLVSSQNNNLETEASGLRSQWHHREINHQLQESQVVNVTAAPELESSTNVHILASDLRAVLREEQQRLREQQKLQQLEYERQQQQNPNLIRLQHNIDEWTEKEFSNSDFNNLVLTEDKPKLTTAAATSAPSKIIPQEYFPTSPSFTVTTPRPSFFDHEAAGSIAHNVHTKVTGSKTNGYKVVNIPEETVVTTEDSTTLTTTDAPVTTFEPRRTTWEQALLGYSSTTREKVYVVTPMSTHQWANEVITTPRYTTSSSTTPTPSTEKTTKGFIIRGRGAIKHQSTASPLLTTISADATAFRSPRFTVRPTPAPREVSQSTSTSAPVTFGHSRGNRYYTVPAPSSYNTARIEKRSSTHQVEETTLPSVSSSAAPVEHAQQHSKIITVVSSSSSSSAPVHSKKATRLSIKTVKTSSVSPASSSTRDEEVAAAVREIAAIDLKRKPA